MLTIINQYTLYVWTNEGSVEKAWKTISFELLLVAHQQYAFIRGFKCSICQCQCCVLIDRDFGEHLRLFRKAHMTLVLIAYAQKPPSNKHADVSRSALGLNICPSLYLLFLVYVY